MRVYGIACETVKPVLETQNVIQRRSKDIVRRKSKRYGSVWLGANPLYILHKGNRLLFLTSILIL